MKRVLFLFLYIILGALIAEPVFSVGVQYGPEDRTIVFSPNIERDYTFNLINADHIHSFVSGDLSQYATIIDNAQDSGPRTILVHVKLPETLDPGFYTMYVGGEEVSDIAGSMGGKAIIKVRIPILSLFDGKYPVFSSIDVKDSNVNDSINVTLNIENYGKASIDDAYGIVDIYDPQGNLVTSLTTDHKNIASNSGVVLVTVFQSANFGVQPGLYKAVGRVEYDGTALNGTREKNFLIGSMLVKVTGSTLEVYPNATNKFTINIESDWSGNIKDVYAKLHTPDIQVIKTPNIDLIKQFRENNPKATGTLETYWEVGNLAPGDYEADIEVFYAGTSSSYTVPVKVITGIAPKVEKPLGFQVLGFANGNIVIMNLSLTMSVFLMIVLALIILFNIYYFGFRKPPYPKNDPGSDVHGLRRPEKP